jgi:peroxiredoxin
VQVRDRFQEIVARGATVLVVSFSPVEALEGYREHLRLPFAIAADPVRGAYRAYGMLTGTRWQVWHPRVIWQYIVLSFRGLKPKLPAKGADLSQLGGDFVIDAGGLIRLAHVSHRPDDRPDVSLLIDALTGAL